MLYDTWMKVGSFIIAALCAAVVTGGSARSANDGTVYVEGKVDCGEWIDARTRNQATPLEHYVLGVLNGLSVGKGVEFWRADESKPSWEAVFLWIDNYCRASPLDTVFNGTFWLYSKRSGWCCPVAGRPPNSWQPQ
jgi:hypothetical protein